MLNLPSFETISHFKGKIKEQMSLMNSSKLCTSKHFGSLTSATHMIEHFENFKSRLWNNVNNRYYSTTKQNNGNLCRETILNFKQMRSLSHNPLIEFTYISVFKACASLSALVEGRQIQVDCLKRGFDYDIYVGNTMVHFYGSCKKIVDARKVFDEMIYKSVVSWNTIISAFRHVSWLPESIEYFMKMRRVEIEPNGTTMMVMLSACAELGNLTMGKCVHSQIIEKGLELTCELGTAFVNMYAKCGDLNWGSLVFNTMHNRNVWTWSAMILGLAQHGLARHALSLFKKMKKTSIQPNYVTFLGVICACSHAGYVEEGYRFFNEMKCVYGIKPRLVHYGAMVDVLGRSGHLTEAYDFILKMTIKPDPTVWRTLLSACNVHSAIDFDEVGQKVRRKLLELEPSGSNNLVMIANKYAVICKWEDVAQLRKRIRVRGLKKMAGESCIEVKGSTFRFLSGYDSQASCVNIYLLLDGLSLNMKINNL